MAYTRYDFYVPAMNFEIKRQELSYKSKVLVVFSLFPQSVLASGQSPFLSTVLLSQLELLHESHSYR